MNLWISAATLALVAAVSIAGSASAQTLDGYEHHYASNGDVRIHYAAAGEGPLVVFIHGFPDFWYSWRHQMEGLRDSHRVVAMDLRGYNLSDKPSAQADYSGDKLVGDVEAVIRAEGRERAVVVGHDWGGFVAWSFAFAHPEMIERLVLVNFPHPRGLTRELAENPRQQENSQYARNFQRPDSHVGLTAEQLAGAASEGDPEVRRRYVEAFERSSLEAMMFYYRQNYPREPYQAIPQTPVVGVPVLQFHGLADTYLLHDALNRTWEWLGDEYMLVTLPDAGHWAHHDESERVTETMRWWLGGN